MLVLALSMGVFFDENEKSREEVIIPNKIKYLYLRAVIDKNGVVKFYYSFSADNFKMLGPSYQMVAGNFRGQW